MKVTLFDYGAGNLHSLAKACECPGATVSIEPDPARAAQADVLVLPGVGAFAAAAERLAPGLKAMRNALEGGLPCLGVCLGMQLFFKDSEEGPGEGLARRPSRKGRLPEEVETTPRKPRQGNRALRDRLLNSRRI